MEPSIASTIVDALSAGALAGTTKAASSAVIDAYGALKSLVIRLSGRQAAIAALEEDPRSSMQKRAVAEVLDQTGASLDPEVLGLSDQLVRLLSELPGTEAAALGLDIDNLRAGSLRLRDIVSEGTAVRMRNTTVAGDIDVSGIVARGKAPSPKN